MDKEFIGGSKKIRYSSRKDCICVIDCNVFFLNIYLVIWYLLSFNYVLSIVFVIGGIIGKNKLGYLYGEDNYSFVFFRLNLIYFWKFFLSIFIFRSFWEDF